MNLYVVGAVVLALAGSHWFAYDVGKDVERGEHAADELKRSSMRDEVRSAISEFGHRLGEDVQARVDGIRLTNRTTIQNIYHEKEVHRVLTDPDCAWPVSTLRVRNAARVDPDPARRAGQRPDGGLPEPPAPPGREAAPPR